MTTPITSALPPPPQEAKPKNGAEAAGQFEALLIAQMLRSARATAGGDDQDSTAETMFDVAGQQFARMLVNNGGLGLAKIISEHLQTRSNAARGATVMEHVP